ncbi:helix-turn-helix domain-containing protein [Rhodovarius crocodyli]|nr:XRE family transcriptional regulator [Rhodovarius crocodyli]
MTFPSADLGARLRASRLNAGLTLDAVSAATTLSKGYLSRVERGLKAPSLLAIQRLSAALSLTMGELFGETTSDGAVEVTRRQDRQRVAGGGAERLFPTRGGGLDSCVIYPGVDLQPRPDARAHAGEEFVLALAGVIELRFVDRGVVLEAGDCAQFPGHLLPRLRRVGEAAASALVVVSRQAG